MAASIRHTIHLGAYAVCALLAPTRGTAQPANQPSSPAVEQYVQMLGLGAPQLQSATTGQPVVKLLKTQDNRDVAVVGIIGVRVSRDAIVARMLEDRAVGASAAGRVGSFSDTPVAADLQNLTIDHSEYRGLHNCRPTDCDFKLSAGLMRTFADSVNWSSPNANREADDLTQREILRLVDDYRARGNAALPTYDDGGTGVRASDAFDALLAESRDVETYAPELFRYLASYPADRPANTRDFFYWAEQRLSRMRPTLTVNHAVVYAPPNGPAFVARKQIFANHYFEGGLELVAIFDASANEGAPAANAMAYLVTVRRFRFDYLPGGLLNVRGRVKSHLVDATRSDLVRERDTLERLRGSLSMTR